MDEQRAEFEAWLVKRWAGDRGGLTKNEAGEYWMPQVQFAWSAYQAATERQQERIAELEAQVQALSLDAGRYRWWRDNACRKPVVVAVLLAPAYTPDQIDAAIDAAIAAGKGEVNG